MKKILITTILILLGCAAYLPSANDPINKECDQCGTIQIFKRSELNNSPLICYHCERRNEYLTRHPEITTDMKEAIHKGNIILGMSGADVIASLGEPAKINRTVSESGIREQWIFKILKTFIIDGDLSYSDKTIYLYFEDGNLTGWQD